MQCKKCGEEFPQKINFCQNCGAKVELTKENKKIPWHQNVKWWGLLTISLVSWIIYYPDGGALWNFIFLFGFIFSLVQFIKEDYFELNKKEKIHRKLLKLLVSIGYIFTFFLLIFIIIYIVS